MAAASPKGGKAARAYARLRALQKNLPTRNHIPEDFVKQYHEGLQHLEELGHDIEEFRVPSNLIKRIPLGRGEYSSPYVERELLLSRLDAVLTHFELVTQKPNPKIRFRPPGED